MKAPRHQATFKGIYCSTAVTAKPAPDTTQLSPTRKPSESVRPNWRGLLLKFPKHYPLADALIQVLPAVWPHFTDGDTEAQRDQGI